LEVGGVVRLSVDRRVICPRGACDENASDEVTKLTTNDLRTTGRSWEGGRERKNTIMRKRRDERVEEIREEMCRRKQHKAGSAAIQNS
jgi:hypothetical protein